MALVGPGLDGFESLKNPSRIQDLLCAMIMHVHQCLSKSE
jgi:hypothetical protein